MLKNIIIFAEAVEGDATPKRSSWWSTSRRVKGNNLLLSVAMIEIIRIMFYLLVESKMDSWLRQKIRGNGTQFLSQQQDIALTNLYYMETLLYLLDSEKDYH
jgi:hypothetical protein